VPRETRGQLGERRLPDSFRLFHFTATDRVSVWALGGNPPGCRGALASNWTDENLRTRPHFSQPHITVIANSDIHRQGRSEQSLIFGVVYNVNRHYSIMNERVKQNFIFRSHFSSLICFFTMRFSLARSNRGRTDGGFPKWIPPSARKLTANCRSLQEVHTLRAVFLC
jgi:hypothetical protein